MILLFAYSKDAFADFHFMKQRKMQIPKSGSLLSLAILPNGLNMVRAALYSISFFGFDDFNFINSFLSTTNCGMHYICC